MFGCSSVETLYILIEIDHSKSSHSGILKTGHFVKGQKRGQGVYKDPDGTMYDGIQYSYQNLFA